MRKRYMITIMPIDGGMSECMATTRDMSFPEGVEDTVVVKIVHDQLHQGLDWLKLQLTPEAVQRLVFGKKEGDSNE